MSTTPSNWINAEYVIKWCTVNSIVNQSLFMKHLLFKLLNWITVKWSRLHPLKVAWIFRLIRLMFSHLFSRAWILFSPARQLSVDHSKKRFKFRQISSTEYRSRTQSEPRIVSIMFIKKDMKLPNHEIFRHPLIKRTVAHSL